MKRFILTAFLFTCLAMPAIAQKFYTETGKAVFTSIKFNCRAASALCIGALHDRPLLLLFFLALLLAFGAIVARPI